MMSSIVQLVQGSPEWYAHRAQYRNASETAIVVGASPWQTPYQLWELRSGRREQKVTPAMAHGTIMEPTARQAYEALTGEVLQPLVLVEGEYSASLDGQTLDGGLIVEIKCPYKGQSSELWQSVAAGQVPEHYWWQVQHQLMLAKAAEAHLYVFDGQEGLLQTVKPEPDRWPEIHAGWDAFMRCLREDVPPELTERDKLIRKDAIWQRAAETYVALKQQADALAGQLDEAKEALVKLAKHPSEAGFGVSVTRYFKQGNVDYKKVPELKDVNLNAFRGPGRIEKRVSMVK